MTDLVLHVLFRLYEKLKNFSPVRASGQYINRISSMCFNIEMSNSFPNAAFNMEDLQRNLAVIRKWEAEPYKKIDSILWFLPPFTEPYAGIINILSYMQFLIDKGITNYLVLLGGKVETSYCRYQLTSNRDYSWLSKVKILENPRIDRLPYADAAVATRCDTAYSLQKYNNTKGKFYFIQDDERLLYEEKHKQDLAEMTYRFGFTCIASADCLKEMYINEFQGRAESYFTALNIKRPYELVKKAKIRKLFFYARPEPGNARNGFNIGIDGLLEIRKRHPDLEIVAAGSDTKFDDKGLGVKQMGKIPLDKLKEFYLSCDAGIYILLSRHSGVIPFELMATSVAVITNKSAYAQCNLTDGENCVTFDLNAVDIANAFDRLYDDTDYYQKIICKGFKYVSQMPPLEEEMERIFRFMKS